MATSQICGYRPGQNCNPNTCQKQLFGPELDRQYFRFAVDHFGIKTSGNAFHALLSPLIRHWQITHEVRIILWVDDICVIVPNMRQAGYLWWCRQMPRVLTTQKIRAWELEAQFTKDIKALGFETNRIDVPPTTLAFFLGLGFDTMTMEFWVPLDKTQVFAASCKELHTRGEATDEKSLQSSVSSCGGIQPSSTSNCCPKGYSI